MRRVVRFEVTGRPATFATAHEAPWRLAVSESLAAALAAPDIVPARPGARFMLRVEFRTPTPRTSNDAWDLDNLIKPTMDALGAVLGYRSWNGPQQAADDAVDRIEATKRPVRHEEEPGALIEVWADALESSSSNSVALDRDRATAFHEAGHIVVGHNMGLIIDGADIEGGDDYAGSTLFEHHDDPDTELPIYATRLELDTDSLDYIQAVMAMSWAGVLAQERAGYGADADDGFGLVSTGTRAIIAAGSDLDHLAYLAGEYGATPEMPPVLMEWMRLTSDAMLTRHWDEVEAVAAHLLDHRTATGDELAAAIEQVREAEQEAFLARFHAATPNEPTAPDGAVH